MESYDPNTADSTSSAIPQGLLKPEPEKNLDESQMAEFSTAIEEVMPGPGQMLQDEVMAPMKKSSGESRRGQSKNPMGLTDEQYHAVLAGVAAVIAFSKPVQGKLGSMVPKFEVDGDLSLTGMVVSALVAAILFYFAKQFLVEK